MQDDIYYDRAELIEAQAAPEYQTSPRYRDEVAAKLQRSMAAGTVTAMGEEITHRQRLEERIVSNTDEGLYGVGNPIEGAHPAWAEAAKVSVGTFGSLE